ncbi:MAG: 30S ribosomal protein S6e [Candidatus Diapherotrites archaeon]|uniref:Small ribosomal subunit protein eS6 n=1 Tax=Candidatus Iainarchaeum sp. TaxID=3101447 RepID=A0A2D6M0P9_9ARCH|nr:30S ribosomal protein S6e [Candidatus Diapherotrites archaeon]|tara:strand:- start:758 stop:1252 length:495 start_codon:yes stop_codon:yes gene_type:complete
MNIVIADPKSGKSFTKKTEEAVFVNKTIGDEIELGIIGLTGYKGKITGGSDKQGFPMIKSLQGGGRKKLLMKHGVGFKAKIKGQKKRKSARGNTVSAEIMQLNLVVTKHSSKAIEEFFKTVEVEEKKEETDESAKERMVKQSLKNVGNMELAEEAKSIKGKVKK